MDALKHAKKTLWNKRIREISPYTAGEQPKNTNIIKLNTNENPYAPSPKVAESVAGALKDLRLYPDPTAYALRGAIAKRYSVDAEQVFVGNGSDETLALAFASFFESGADAKPVLFPDITYSFYPVYANLWGVPYKTLALKADFSLTPSDFCVDCGGIVFPNPNAPTGIALGKTSVLEIAGRNAGRVVIVDEAYGAFAENTSVVSAIRDFPNLLTVHTLSKWGALAGLRVGFAIGDADLIEGLCRARDSFNSYPIDRLALAGAQAAVEDSAYYEARTQEIIATRERVARELRAMGVEVLPSQANFLFVRSPTMAGEAWFAGLREAGVLVRRFSMPRITDFLRVSIGTDTDMDYFLDVCAKLFV